MFRRIVVPLDGSDPSGRALPPAEELARLTGAPLHLVRVVDTVFVAKSLGYPLSGPSVETSSLIRSLEDEEAAARAYLAGMEAALAERGVPATAALLRGGVAGEIVGAARPGDLIVMATHGRGGLPRWFLGSVAEDVVRRAGVPVMLVRAAPAVGEPDAVSRPAAGAVPVAEPAPVSEGTVAREWDTTSPGSPGPA